MRSFRHTILCTRPLVPAWTDDMGNMQGAARPAVNFQAVFVPPGTQVGSQIIDGVLRAVTTTKPTLMVDRRTENAAALVPGAIRSTDPITVNGVDDYQVDGDPADYLHPWTGWRPPLWIEIRRTVG